MAKCIIESCSSEATTRGLCDQHYNAAREMIGKKVTTWEELERLGKALPAQRGGGVGRGKLQTDFFSTDELRKRSGMAPPKPPPVSPDQPTAL